MSTGSPQKLLQLDPELIPHLADGSYCVLANCSGQDAPWLPPLDQPRPTQESIHSSVLEAQGASRQPGSDELGTWAWLI